MSVPYVTELSEFQTIISQNYKVAVDFTASWCGPCKMIGPKFEEMAADSTYSRWKFIKVDIDDGEEIASELNIQAMPTFMFYVNGKLANQFSGANEASLTQNLNTL